MYFNCCSSVIEYSSIVIYNYNAGGDTTEIIVNRTRNMDVMCTHLSVMYLEGRNIHIVTEKVQYSDMFLKL
jgi:hypothetical protein